MSRKQEFLLELADLLDKHSVAICSRKSDFDSEVFFQMNTDHLSFDNINTGRFHSSGYEIRCIANDKMIDHN